MRHTFVFLLFWIVSCFMHCYSCIFGLKWNSANSTVHTSEESGNIYIFEVFKNLVDKETKNVYVYRRSFIGVDKYIRSAGLVFLALCFFFKALLALIFFSPFNAWGAKQK